MFPTHHNLENHKRPMFHVVYVPSSERQPWSQVPSLLPNGTRLHFNSVEGSAFPLIVDFHRISLTHAVAAFGDGRSHKKITTQKKIHQPRFGFQRKPLAGTSVYR